MCVFLFLAARRTWPFSVVFDERHFLVLCFELHVSIWFSHEPVDQRFTGVFGCQCRWMMPWRKKRPDIWMRLLLTGTDPGQVVEIAHEALVLKVGWTNAGGSFTCFECSFGIFVLLSDSKWGESQGRKQTIQMDLSFSGFRTQKWWDCRQKDYRHGYLDQSNFFAPRNPGMFLGVSVSMDRISIL